MLIHPKSNDHEDYPVFIEWMSFKWYPLSKKILSPQSVH